MASVSFRNIEKSFGKVQIIKGLGFDITDGEFVVLVGPSGCGKSTLLRMLAGLEDISGGEIVIDGRVVNDLESKDRDIAMVFQSYALYPHMTVGENMGFSLRLRNAEKSVTDERVMRAAKILNLDALLGRYPRELSGGQRQRVVIARSLALDPEVLVADEPVSALDLSVQSTILELLATLRAERELAYVVISHDLAVIKQLCSDVAVMFDGRIVERGRTDDVFAAPRHPHTRLLLGAVPGGDWLRTPSSTTHQEKRDAP
jgi:multiple sugar transport system ATP-binding protein